MSKKKNKENEFDKEQLLTGGNLFNTRQHMKAMEEFDKSTIFDEKTKETTNYGISYISKKIRDIGDKFFSNGELDWYWLLQLQANYFINTIKWELEKDDYLLQKKIINVIRSAFFNGRAGLYFNKKLNKISAVSIIKYETNIYGEVSSIDISYQLEDINTNRIIDYSNGSSKYYKEKISGEDVNNVAIFQWGSAGIGAYIMMLPFVRNQQKLLKMLSIQFLSFNKKYDLKVYSDSFNVEEIETILDPNNPFLLNFMNTDFNSKIGIVENNGGSDTLDLVEFYKQWCGIWYSLYGRRQNNDYKQERNNLNETNLTTLSYDVLEKDWIDQFIIFTKQVKQISNIVINVNNDMNEEKDEDNENWETDREL